MTFEWIKMETCLLDDSRIKKLYEDRAAQGLGVYLILRNLIDSQGPTGANPVWVDYKTQSYGFSKTFKTVLNDYDLFGYTDRLMLISKPLSADNPSCTLVQASSHAQGSTQGSTQGTTPESSLRDNSLAEENNKDNLERERGRHTSPAVGRSSSRPKFFIPPTIEEVEAYCKEKGYHIDAEQFVMYYEQKGWRVKGDKMTKWKAAVSTWVLRDKHSAKNDPANRRDKNIHDASYIKPYTGYLPPNAPPRPTPTAVWSISVDAWVEPYGPNRLKPIVGLACGT